MPTSQAAPVGEAEPFLSAAISAFHLHPFINVFIRLLYAYFGFFIISLRHAITTTETTVGACTKSDNNGIGAAFGAASQSVLPPAGTEEGAADISLRWSRPSHEPLDS